MASRASTRSAERSALRVSRSTKSLIRLAAALPLLACLAVVLPPALAQEPEIRWKEASSGVLEVPLGSSFDLDFQSGIGADFDAQFEPWEGGSFWAPKRGCSVAVLGVKDLGAIDMNAAYAAERRSARIYLCGGGGSDVEPGTVLIASTSDARYSKVMIESCGATLNLRYVTYNREVIQPKAVPVTAGLGTPGLLSPPDDVSFDHDPRDLLLAWTSVRGATTYTLELDCKGCCAPRKELWCADQENGAVFRTLPGLTTTAYYTIWSGPNAGRWRVCGVQTEKGPDGKPRDKMGPWSSWRTFSFKK